MADIDATSGKTDAATPNENFTNVFFSTPAVSYHYHLRLRDTDHGIHLLWEQIRDAMYKLDLLLRSEKDLQAKLSHEIDGLIQKA